MKKAILVIDMPSCCKDCPLCISENFIPSVDEYRCIVKNVAVDVYSKPDWCPLKELPEKLEGNNSIYYQWGDYEDGWNHCIDNLIDE